MTGIVMEPEPKYTSHCIPPEMLTQVLSYLPVKSLLRFRSVSQEWKSIIDSPDFCRLHLSCYPNNQMETHLIAFDGYVEQGAIEPRVRWFSYLAGTKNYQQTSEFDFPIHAEPLFREKRHFVIAGDVHGLLLVQSTRGRLSPGDAFLWNPSIRKSLSIPLPPSLPQNTNLCLGFDPSTNDYKVVNMVRHEEVPTLTVEIFSLNSRSWSNSRSCSGTELCFMEDDYKVSLGGSVYWMGYDYSFSNTGFASFNVTSETFSLVPLPYIPIEPVDRRIGVLGIPVVVAGSLVGLLTSYNGITDIWVLEKDDCWSKRFTFNTMIWYDAYERLHLNKDGVLFWIFYSHGDEVDGTICASDIITGKRRVVSECDEWWSFYFVAFIESLVLLS